LEEASTAIESIEKERNFYFLKLQKIETYCQNAGENAEVPTKPIFDVLYEVEEGFAAPEDIETNGVDEEAEENPNVTVTKTTQPHDDWQEEEAIPNARMNGDESLTF
uniref:EB1 C-terminal domain-containing protein n=1 Tax=Anisakis simplex TaxID=6269 RepID=A0A0M3JCF8_ANISI